MGGRAPTKAASDSLGRELGGGREGQADPRAGASRAGLGLTTLPFFLILLPGGFRLQLWLGAPPFSDAARSAPRRGFGKACGLPGGREGQALGR